MPELPEVEITVRKLKKAGLEGVKLAYFKFFSLKQLRSSMKPTAITKDVKGREIERFRRHGKVIFMDVSGKPRRIAAVHLKMSGRLFIAAKNESLERGIRFIAGLKDGREIRFKDPRRFGIIWYDLPEKIFKDRYLASLGPDMLDISFTEFKKRLLRHKGALKPVLLRQDVFAGIGNIIADEALWQSKIHPKMALLKLHNREILRLYKNIKKVIKTILKHGGTSMRDWRHPDKNTGNYQKYFRIYRRMFCPRCRAKTEKLIIGGRTSSICSRCQNKPS